jgi:hypothetical protein
MGSLGYMIYDLAGVLHLRDILDITTPVCKPCNDWMSQWAEESGKETLKELVIAARTREFLSRSQQMRIAIWLFKTAVMWDASERYTGPRGAPAEVIRYFHQHGIPTDGVTVWIGQMSSHFIDRPAQQHVEPEPNLNERIMVFDSWGPAMAFFRLFALIDCQPEATYEPVRLPLEADRYLIRIWPAVEPVVSWPPPEVIDRPAYAALGSMLVSVPPLSPDPVSTEENTPMRYLPHAEGD